MANKKTAPTFPLTIQRFDKAKHDRSRFSCGHTPINNFLKSSLSDQERLGMVAAYLATPRNETAVLGFYTLGALAVRADFGPQQWHHAHVPDIPVFYIRVVAVRADKQSKEIGTALLIDAVLRCLRLSKQMSAAAIVLDVLGDGQFQQHFRFYAGLGFQPMIDPDNPRRVFISTADVQRTIG